MAAYAEKGIKAHGYVCDVTDEPAVQAMVATIEKEVGDVYKRQILLRMKSLTMTCWYSSALPVCLL